MMPDLGTGTEVNQWLIMLAVVLSPIFTFIGVEWRNERRQSWEAKRLKAERDTLAANLAAERGMLAANLAAERDADRIEREQVAAVIKAQLDADAQKLRHTVNSQIATVSQKSDQLQKKLEQNTELTTQAAAGATKAYEEANTLNQKIAEQSELSAKAARQLAEVQRRFDILLQNRQIDRIDQDERITAIKETTESIEDVSTDTNTRVRNIEGQTDEPDAAQ